MPSAFSDALLIGNEGNELSEREVKTRTLCKIRKECGTRKGISVAKRG
jgi:hypothetical protein